MGDTRTSASGATPAATPAAPATAPTLAQALARFGHAVAWAGLPEPVRERARLHALDALGLALASHAQPFAAPSLAGIAAAGSPGECTVIGDARRLAARDAAMANGLLMHGLDYDDTHLASIVHPSVVGLPAALAVGESIDADWRDVLAAYAVGVEAGIRIGLAVQGGFHHAGFHATGLVAHFGAALAAGKLLGLTEDQLTAAQGLAASTASGLQIFLEEGAWNKRLHPGWGALAGITAARIVQHGFKAPTRPYEGRFGLFESHLHEGEASAERMIDGLGTRWHLLDIAIKPYPVCHFNHGCIDAAIELHREAGGAAIRSVTAWLAKDTLPIVAEPAADKQHVRTEYQAKFSVQYAVAKGLLYGRLGLPELTPEAIADPATRDLAPRVECRADPDSLFPKYFSGGVTVELADGRRLHRHVPVNKGAGDRALPAGDIQAKFLANAALHLGPARAEAALAVALQPGPMPVRKLLAALAG